MAPTFHWLCNIIIKNFMKRNSKGQFMTGDKIDNFVNFTENEKYEYAISKGFTYDENTGEIISPSGNVIKNKNKLGYINIQIYQDRENKYTLSAHRFAWFFIYKEVADIIDHINGLPSDNRIINLRNVTQLKNCWNKKGKSKGCYYDKTTNKWQVRLGFKNKRLFLGYYDSEQQAHQVYLEAKKIYHKI